MVRMKRFPYGHATHPDWRMAVSLVVAQIRGRMAQKGYANHPGLGLAYFSDHFAPHAEALLEALQDEFPEVSNWSGAVGVGVIATQAEYMGEAAYSPAGAPPAMPLNRLMPSPGCMRNTCTWRAASAGRSNSAPTRSSTGQ